MSILSTVGWALVRRTRVGAAAALLLAVGWLAALLWFPAPPAVAAQPVATEPQARAELDRPPGAVTLAFDFEVDPSVAKVLVLDAHGANVSAGTLIVEGTNVTTLLEQDLSRGTYTVHYRVARSGGETQGGAYQFSYGKGSFSAPADRSWTGSEEEPPVIRGTNPNGPDDPAATSPPKRRAGPGTSSPIDSASSPAIDPSAPEMSPTQSTTTTAAPSADPSSAGSAGGPSQTTDTPDSAASSAVVGTASGSAGATPFVVGGILLAAVGIGGAVALRHQRRRAHE